VLAYFEQLLEAEICLLVGLAPESDLLTCRTKLERRCTLRVCSLCFLSFCQSVSRSRHSQYRRSLLDLLMQGTRVILRVHVGAGVATIRLRRQNFTECPLNVCAPHARETELRDWRCGGSRRGGCAGEFLLNGQRDAAQRG
jgi:hypothetical protein